MVKSEPKMALKRVYRSDEEPTLETLEFTFHIGSTPTFLYFDLYLNTAYAAHYVYRSAKSIQSVAPSRISSLTFGKT